MFLKFDNINRTDAGQYTCRANNSVDVTSTDTTIVVYCKYILTLIFNFWIYFTYSVTPVTGVSYTKLTNFFKSLRTQNSTSNPFWLCMHWSQVFVGTIEFWWSQCSHYFALEDVKIFLPSHTSVGLQLTQKMAWSHFWVIWQPKIHSKFTKCIFWFCVRALVEAWWKAENCLKF